MNEVFFGEVRDLSSMGLGVADHPDGRVFFIPGTWPGDRGYFEVEQEKKRYGFARVQELTSPSRDRAGVQCEHHGFEGGACGGCPWMGIRYSAQLRVKENFVRYQLKRSGLYSSGLQIHSIEPTKNQFGYRNRASLKTDGKKIGFLSRKSKELVDILSCSVLTPQAEKILESLRKRLPSAEWEPEKGYLYSIIELDDEASESFRVNQRFSFRQANASQNLELKKRLRGLLSDVSRDRPILELFSGSGNLTEVLVEVGFTGICAIESAEESLNLLRLRFPIVRTVQMNLHLQKNWKSLNSIFPEISVMLLDPTRVGFRQIDRFVARMRGLTKIIYVSCHLHSFISDTHALSQKGWILKEVHPFDFFPQTPHVELIGVLEKQSRK